MKWIGITGSWRLTNAEVERDVRAAVRDIFSRGDGIVTGGALNVDAFALDEALKLDPSASRIQVCLPVTLDRYAAHYRKRASEGVITFEQAETLIAQLTQLKAANSAGLVEHPTNTVCDTTTYFERNTEVVNRSDEILAFQVNESGGAQDTIEKALAQGKPVVTNKYKIN